MSEIKIELTSETELKDNIVEGIRFTTQSLTNEDIEIQIGINAVTLSKRDLIHLLDSTFIDEDFLSEIEELQGVYLANQADILMEDYTEGDYEEFDETYEPEEPLKLEELEENKEA